MANGGSRSSVHGTYEILRRQVTWSLHAAIGLLHDLQYSIEISDERSTHTHVRGFLSHVLTVSEYLWSSGGKRLRDRLAGGNCELLRKAFNVDDKSLMRPVYLEQLWEQIDGCWTSDGLAMPLEDRARLLHPLSKEVTDLWHKLAAEHRLQIVEMP